MKNATLILFEVVAAYSVVATGLTIFNFYMSEQPILFVGILGLMVAALNVLKNKLIRKVESDE